MREEGYVNDRLKKEKKKKLKMWDLMSRIGYAGVGCGDDRLRIMCIVVYKFFCK